MPRVKIEYVVSFSNEDPEHSANNLLATEVSKKRWLCTKGTPTCSVVLQLARCVRITNLQICSHHASLIEVLVGRSETPDQPFKVLVPSCVFITPSEARNSDAVEKVRSFDYGQLASDTRDSSWDRVRVVCSQPYNKHCKYGLSFIHIFGPEGDSSSITQSSLASGPTPIPPRLLDLDTKSSDDEDTFKPGELFAKFRASTTGTESSQETQNLSTDAQIRQATAKALKNIPKASTRVVKSPIVKDKSKTGHGKTKRSNDSSSDRQRDELLYTADDGKPNSWIDRLVDQRNKEKEQQKEDRSDKHSHSRKNCAGNQKGHDDNQKGHDDHGGKGNVTSKTKKDTNVEQSGNEKEREAINNDKPSTKASNNSRKRTLSGDHASTSNNQKKAKIPRSRSPHRLLEDVVFVLSGYENPRRGNLRCAGLAMGAKYERDWTPRCTHLICAFPNTPKLRAVRGGWGGDTAVVVTGEWLEECCRRRRRLPWQWFATEPKRRQPADESFLDSSDEAPSLPDSEKDTDDEIEKVLHEQRKRQSGSKSPTKSPKQEDNGNKSETRANVSHDSDVAFVCDERLQGEIVLSDSDGNVTEEDCSENLSKSINCKDPLPELFDEKNFLIDNSVEESGFDVSLLKRYIKAYGGEYLKNSQITKDTEVDYILCGAEPARGAVSGAVRVRADWLWQCHRDKKVVSTRPYLFMEND